MCHVLICSQLWHYTCASLFSRIYANIFTHDAQICAPHIHIFTSIFSYAHANIFILVLESAYVNRQYFQILAPLFDMTVFTCWNTTLVSPYMYTNIFVYTHLWKILVTTFWSSHFQSFMQEATVATQTQTQSEEVVAANQRTGPGRGNYVCTHTHTHTQTQTQTQTHFRTTISQTHWLVWLQQRRRKRPCSNSLGALW